MATYTFYVKVQSVGGSNKYFIDSVQQDSLDLGHDITYKFDQSDSSNAVPSSHPLRFSTTSDGTHNSGSEYTTGVTTNGSPGSAGAYTQIAVTSSTAATLYYYCSSHSGMGGSIATTADEFTSTSLGLKKPVLGNATDTWGAYINQTADVVDQELAGQATSLAIALG